MLDETILEGLKSNREQRSLCEKELYLQYKYFIGEGSRKYHLSYDDSFSAYSDALLSAIHSIVNCHFQHSSSLKTYLYQIFSNKCVDLVRKNATNKNKVNQTAVTPDLVSYLPDAARTVIEKLIDSEKISAIKKHLDTIGGKCREILLLFEDGYSDKEIAERLAFSNAAVAKTSRLRCREKIRTLLSNHE